MSEYELRFGANSQQAEYWNSEAGRKWVHYDAEMDNRLRPMTEELLQRSSIGPGARVLDIGCGAGSTTERISRAVGPTGGVLGLDISEPLLSLARTRCAGLPNVRFENSDAQVHSFSAKGFDLLFSRFGVMFFSDPPAAFMNLSGALRTNGRLHFVCWAAADKNPWFSIPLEVAKHHLDTPEPTPVRAPGPLAFSEPDYVEGILTTAGFREIKIETVATTMASLDSAEQQAELYLKMGPASRVVSAMSPDAATMKALTEDLVSELRSHETEAGIALAATVHYVAATA